MCGVRKVELGRIRFAPLKLILGIFGFFSFPPPREIRGVGKSPPRLKCRVDKNKVYSRKDTSLVELWNLAVHSWFDFSRVQNTKTTLQKCKKCGPKM